MIWRHYEGIKVGLVVIPRILVPYNQKRFVGRDPDFATDNTPEGDEGVKSLTQLLEEKKEKNKKVQERLELQREREEARITTPPPSVDARAEVNLSDPTKSADTSSEDNCKEKSNQKAEKGSVKELCENPDETLEGVKSLTQLLEEKKEKINIIQERLKLQSVREKARASAEARSEVNPSDPTKVADSSSEENREGKRTQKAEKGSVKELYKNPDETSEGVESLIQLLEEKKEKITRLQEQLELQSEPEKARAVVPNPSTEARPEVTPSDPTKGSDSSSEENREGKRRRKVEKGSVEHLYEIAKATGTWDRDGWENVRVARDWEEEDAQLKSYEHMMKIREQRMKRNNSPHDDILERYFKQDVEKRRERAKRIQNPDFMSTRSAAKVLKENEKHQ